MKLVIYVMNDIQLLDRFLKRLKERGIRGATIINSTGMGRKLASMEDSIALFGGLKALFDSSRSESNVILMASEDDHVAVIYDTIHEVAGDLSKPNSGIVFTVPLDNVEGYKK